MMSGEPSADFVAKEKIDFGGLFWCPVIGALMIWLGIHALAPAWTSEAGEGLKIVKLIKLALAWLDDYRAVRGSILIVLGSLLVLLGFFLALHYAF
jgi:hypothetical protein